MFYPMLAGNSIGGGFASIEAESAQNTARDAQAKIALLTHDVDRLLLITEALWTLMKQQQGCAEDVLIKTIEEIDRRRLAQNGVAVKSPPQICSGCGRPNSGGRLHCVYCGKPLEGNPFER